MKSNAIKTLIVILCVCGIVSCAESRIAGAPGPGMIITFSNSIPGKKVDMEEIITDGIYIPSPGMLGPSNDPNKGGSTMGAAPDNRGLPEWVEFQWKEWPYPSEPYPQDFQAQQKRNAEILKMNRTLPIKSERVKVRERIPVDVIERLMQARRHPVAGQDLSLWVTFRWYSSGVRFHWELNDGCCDLKQEGGDIID